MKETIEVNFLIIMRRKFIEDCYFAKLVENPQFNAAGQTEKAVVNKLLNRLKKAGLPHKKRDYKIMKGHM